MNVEDISYSDNVNKRSNHYLLPQRSIRGLIIGKSDCGKATLLNNLLLRDGWLEYDRLYVFGKSLHQSIYQLLQQALGKGFPKEDIRERLQCKGKSPHSFIDMVNALPPPRHPKRVDTFFFEQGSDVPDPQELDPNHKNLMVFDELMLSKQNTCENCYVRSRHNNVDCCVRSTSNCPDNRSENFICLFQQDAKNLDHNRHDHCNDLTKEQFDALCKHSWSQPYGFVTIDLTSPKSAGKYRCKLDEFYNV
ncbi:Hypothetical predicted protein [Mytilus galloprovincialis]|uniref:Uncharacterized protein n=1 Tax=Mytilus galloprovincialis TaxID=29158 RepID=A0A8B6HR00_MYTGA|nr:Hypothetical predicted protein [Mytilus galloprovincialis]